MRSAASAAPETAFGRVSWYFDELTSARPVRRNGEELEERMPTGPERVVAPPPPLTVIEPARRSSRPKD